MFEARYYQTEAVQSVFDYFERGNEGNPVIAMPTGTGKSLVIAMLIARIFQAYPNQRVMMLTHVKKLIEQNAQKLIDFWPCAPLGVYSAGLNSRDMALPIIFGGVQSVAKAIKRAVTDGCEVLPPQQRHFGWRDLILIDECHLLSPNEETEYRYAINELKKINPYLKVIGLSATPYRMKQGLLNEEGGLFTHICYDITGIESFNRMIAEGFMSPIIARPTNTVIDMNGVSIVAGEFNQKETSARVDTDEVTYSACREIIEAGHGRTAWMVFGQSIENAEHINDTLLSFGIASTVVHSKLTPKEIDERLRAYQAGYYQVIVNKDMLTTGFDHPPIDLIADLQPTMSPGKHVQKWGRGTRPSPATRKQNCRGLDFARNVASLGPINDPRIPRKPGKGGGDAPVRICDACGVYNHASAKVCCNCGALFTFETKIFAMSGTADIIKGDDPIVEYFAVHKVLYNLHLKKDKDGNLTSPPSIKVSYFCEGFKMFNEWVMLEHSGPVAHRAREWWKQRHAEEPPITTHLALARASELRQPNKIRVHTNAKFPQVLSYEW